MSKKVKGRNAFYFFMLDWKERQKMPNLSLQQVAADPRCNEEWRNLSPVLRGDYESRAKNHKIQAQGSVSKKNTLGQNLDEVVEEKNREEQFIQDMMKYVSSVVSMGARHGNLEDLKFIFVHVNWFYVKPVGINKYEYGPAEFAVSEFSLKNGTENVYHEILNIPIPLGYKGQAIDISSQSHGIPIEFPNGESDFRAMYAKLMSFLESNMTGNNKIPPLFTMKNLKPAVDSLLRSMCRDADRSVDEFKVYSVEVLFAELQNAAVKYASGDLEIPLVVAEIEFGKDVYAYTCGAECYFHKLRDNASQYCSKSVVTRWGYTMCDYCCNHMGIEMIEGVHYPVLNYDDVDELNESIEWLTVGRNNKDANGVSEEHRTKVSERTDAQEQRRRAESKPLNIIDHAKNTDEGKPGTHVHLPQRSLRPPNTKSLSAQVSDENCDSAYEQNFPSFGRGVRSKTVFKSLGRGRNF